MIQAAAGTQSDLVRRHLWALHSSSDLTNTFRRMYQRMAAKVTPERVLEVLHQAGVRCVIMGTHALGTWRSEPRATQDVDVLVRKKDVRKALRALGAEYPVLTVEDTPAVARFIDPASGKSVLDVLKPTESVYQLVFRHTIPVGEAHSIPNLEMALTSKFAAMVSPNRPPAKKMVDGGDFMDVVIHNRSAIDLPKLKRLAGKVYPNGGAEIMRMIADIDAGRTIQL
jgi:hypothetical protein